MEGLYDHVVVGGGVSGMTAALLLGLNGRSVLLLEKAQVLGGSMRRFRVRGVPFDTGFHFTGGLETGGLLDEMLRVLGIRDHIESVPFEKEGSNTFVLESTGEAFPFSTSRGKLIQRMKSSFPEEEGAIDRYFEKVDSVCGRTPNMELRNLACLPESLEEDVQSLAAVLDGLTDNVTLKTLLSSYCMCYGVRPDEVSFANHARMCQALYRDLVRVKGGGQSFVDAFSDALSAAGVTVACGRHITDCEDIQNERVGRFRLNTGETVSFDTCLFTIHPKSVLDVLPQSHFRHAFIHRVADFEPSAGFFSVFGVCEEPEDWEDCMVTLLPHTDVNEMFSPGFRDRDSALVVISGLELRDGKPCRAVTALETSCPEDYEEWRDSRVGERPESYEAWKRYKTERIQERILRQYPHLKDRFRILTSSSVLTYRDYLNSPDGSAYGVKQKMGQYNLFGKLPLRNLYVAGQSSLLPGVMGAMMSSFIVARRLLDSKEFHEFVLARPAS